MPIRLRGNTKHTQRNGWEPADITVELTVDREEDYTAGTIRQWIKQVRYELQLACDDMNIGTSASNGVSTNPFSSTKVN